MIRLILILLISIFIFSLESFANPSEKAFCVTRFDPEQSDFTLEIKPSQKNCNPEEKQIEIKKERLGIWLFYLLNENPEKRNEEKYGSSNSSKE